MWPYSTLLNVLAVTVVFIIIMSVYFLWSRTRSYANYKYVPSAEQMEEKTLDVYDVPIYKDEEDTVVNS
jgi:CHASE3 domain sensor protein